jgi:osmotically-inducible protein OsmY
MKYIAVLLALLTLAACRTNQSPEAQVDDLEIATQAKAKLASDIGPATLTNISVNSTNGVVTLAGQVDSADTKAKAVAIVRAVPKVTRVVDNLQITPKLTSWNRMRGVLASTIAGGPCLARRSA